MDVDLLWLPRLARLAHISENFAARPYLRKHQPFLESLKGRPSNISLTRAQLAPLQRNRDTPYRTTKVIAIEALSFRIYLAIQIQ